MHLFDRISHPSHTDITGDYQAALEHIIDTPGESPKELC